MKLFKKIIVHVIGFSIMTFAVSLIVKSEQGAFPYDAISYYISQLIPHDFMTIGRASILFGSIWIILNFIVIKKAYVFWSFIIVLGFGSLMDIWFLTLLSSYSAINHDLWFNVIMAFFGLILLGFSLSIIITNKTMPMAPSEVFLIHIKQFINKTWIAKVFIEIVMIVLAILLATIAKDFIQIGWFTLVSAFLLGPIIGQFEKIVVPALGDLS